MPSLLWIPLAASGVGLMLVAAAAVVFVRAIDSFGRGAVKPMSFDLEVPNVN